MRLLVCDVDFDDGFCVLEAVFPRHDDANRGSVLVRQDVAVAAEGQQGEGVHGFVHAQAFGVGPVVAAGEVTHLLAVEVGGELDELGAGKRLAEVDELRERVAVPGDDHRPGFDAAVAVHAALDGAVAEEVVDVDGLRLLHHAGDLDGPGAGLEGMGVASGIGLVCAELVEIVVVCGFAVWRLIFCGGVVAWDGFEWCVGVDGVLGMDEAGDAGGDGSSAQKGCSGEEAAAVLVVFLDYVLGRDL